MEEYILNHGSYLAIILLLAGTGAGLPLPEEVIVVAAGVLSSPSVNSLDPLTALLACLVGTIVGDCIMYGIGRGLGQRFLRRSAWFQRVMSQKREERIVGLVQRHGFKMFVLARFLVGMRSPIYLSMGIMRITFLRFVVRDAIAAAIAVSVFFCLSYSFGGWIGPRIRQSQQAVTAGVLVIAALVGLYCLILKKLKRRMQLDEHTAESPDSAAEQ